MNFEQLKKQAEIFKSISHETRLAILHLLAEKEMSVNEIVDSLNEKERTGVSKHIAILKDNGLISFKESGTKRIYRLEAHCLLNAANCTLDLIQTHKPCKNCDS